MPDDVLIDGEYSLHIAAPPARVYELVADITRMGDWSPECRSCDWTGGATGPATGAAFTGKNAVGDFEWEVPCEVTAAEPGRKFEFVAGGATTWTYEFEADGSGTKVTERFHAPALADPDSPGGSVPGRHGMLVDGCRATLEAVKQAAEAS